MRLKRDGNKATKISDLFEKYKNTLKAPQGIVIDNFREVVEDLLGLPIKKEQVKYTVHSRTLSINVQGPLKSEIKLRKKEILNHLKGRLGDTSAPLDII
jgi:hypothetical protein